MKWARIKDAANEVETTNTDPTGRYVDTIAQQFFPCNDAVTDNSVFHGGNAMDLASWTVYTPPAPPAPGPAAPPTVTAARFYNLFGLQSSIDIKNSTDPFVAEMYHRVNLMITSNDTVDMNTTFVRNMLGYLETTNTAPATTPVRTYISGADVTRILTNTLPSM